jgi:tRNA/tmRNA/rRNA uracil-C5-methylase (TrmA/RlmC/RlmD family)
MVKGMTKKSSTDVHTTDAAPGAAVLHGLDHPEHGEGGEVIAEDLVSFIDPRDAADVLREKAAAAKAALAPVCNGVTIDVVPSPTSHWRQRCRFGVSHHRDSGNAIDFFVERAQAPGDTLADGPDGPDTVRVIDSFPIASAAVTVTMRLLRQEIGVGPAATHLVQNLCTVGIHGTQAGPPPEGDVVVSLFYSQPLDPARWMAAAEVLRVKCGFAGVVGRAKKARLVCGRDYVVETLCTADGRVYTYRQTEGHFSNPNSHIAALTLDWLCEQSRRITADVGSQGQFDLLEMFCGNGNHTMALAGCGAFRKVVGVEINSVLVAAAQHNIQANGVGDRCLILRAPSAKFVTKVMKKSSVAALKSLAAKKRAGHAAEEEIAGLSIHGDAGATANESTDADGGIQCPAEPTHIVEGNPYCFRTVLVDPPRAGLDDATRSHVRRCKLSTPQANCSSAAYVAARTRKLTKRCLTTASNRCRLLLSPLSPCIDRNILYISCNPAALRRDIEGLAKTHAVKSAAIFDHFPRTPHLETAVHLAARPSWHEPD